MGIRAFFRPTNVPLWQPDRRRKDGKNYGKLSEELEAELWIWRPILAGKVSLTEVKSGVVEIDDLNKLNALIDMTNDIESSQYEDAKSK